MITTNQAIAPKMTTPVRNVSRRINASSCIETVLMIRIAGKVATDRTSEKTNAQETMTRLPWARVSGSSPV
jgi:hypothetical protein